MPTSHVALHATTGILAMMVHVARVISASHNCVSSAVIVPVSVEVLPDHTRASALVTGNTFACLAAI